MQGRHFLILSSASSTLMSLPGRPKDEYRSAKHVGCLMSLPGRPKGEYRSAQHGG